MKLLEAALAYAGRGWRVFPIRPGQKRPATENGLLDATCDPLIIDRWWTARKGYEERNIAVVTSPKSGIWVLDSDVDKETGEVGEDTIADLEKEFGRLPTCPMQSTPGGGHHRFFAWPADGLDLPRRIRFRPGLDALGSRHDEGEEKAGYLVIAPSSRPDGDYRWIVSPDECDLPQAPQWLVKMVREGKKERPQDLQRIAPVINGSTTPYGRATLARLCDEIASCPPGSQDDTLVRKATRIGSVQAGGNIDYQEAFTAAVEAGMRMSNGDSHNPWTRKVVEKKVAKAMAYGAKDPTFVEARPAREYSQEQAPPIGEKVERAKPQLIVSNPEKPKEEKKNAREDWAKNRWQIGLVFVLNDEGVPKSTSLRNLQLYMRHHPVLKELYWYDEFRDEIFISGSLPDEPPIGEYPRPIQDHDETALAGWLNANGLAPSISACAAAIREAAFSRPRNPFNSWASCLKWDGVKRIDTWLTYYAGAVDTEYVRTVARKFLISSIARGTRPGCKVDTMLILEGPQGLKKSSLVRALAGDEWFSDQVGDVTNKDASQLIQGVWIMEIPEMDKFSRAEANAVKDFLTRRFDRYRPPYGRNVVRRERRCVFFGTINPDGAGYLKDTTGNRRYWPVTVTSVDLDGIIADRDQLWAEAKAALDAGEEWWLTDEENQLAEPEQDQRRDDDPWEDPIKAWLDDPQRRLDAKPFTSGDVLRFGLGIELAKHDKKLKDRVAKILKMLGLVKKNNTNGITGRSWEYPKDWRA